MDEETVKALTWVEEQLKGKVDTVEPLKGGQSSILHLLKIIYTSGENQEVVLREYHDKEWLKEEPDIAQKEARNLMYIKGLSICTPKLIAADPYGKKTGRPTLLMTKVSGEINIKPKNLSNWLKQLAETLYEIHQLKPSKEFSSYFAYYNKQTLVTPSWSGIPCEWQRCFDKLLYETTPKAEVAFIHRDYHPMNTLWQKEQLIGIVDWPNACIGPREIDLGHCRWNLCMMYGIEAADLFLKYYENRAKFTYNYYWDLEALANVFTEEPPEVHAGWTAFELPDIHSSILSTRMDLMLKNTLSKIE